MTDKQIYQIGLTMINGVGDILARHLLEALGDAEAVFTEKRQSLEKISGIGDSIIAEIKRADVLLRAEKELAFAQKNGISIYFLKDMNYPERLRECPDAPVLFYFKGNADLNAAHIISVVSPYPKKPPRATRAIRCLKITCRPKGKLAPALRC